MVKNVLYGRWKGVVALFAALTFMFANAVPAFADDGSVGDLGKVIGRDDRTRISRTTVTPYAQIRK